LKVRSIASGSSGNAYAVEHDGRTLLIDCGVPYKHLKDLAIDAVLITHSHSDHVSGLKVLLKHCDAPVFANSMTAETVARCCGLDDEVFVRFENDQVFEVGDFEISPFSIPSRIISEPRFDVIMIIVFLKSTVLPLESVILPSSST
jgi:phosphoribosyl 1,2-cyclic phosphodiesterase